MKISHRFSLRQIVTVGIMAALCFVTYYFFKVKIPTPVGSVSLHFGNMFGVIAGLVFGPATGALTGALGLGLADILSDITYLPSTLVCKSIMGFSAGKIARLGGKNGESIPLNFIAALTGLLLNTVVYWTYSIILQMLLGNVFAVALASTVPNLAVSLLNTVFNAVVAVPLAVILKAALKRAKLI